MLKNNDDPKITEHSIYQMIVTMKCVIIYVLYHIIYIVALLLKVYLYTQIPNDLIFIKLPLLRSLLDNSLGLHTFFVWCYCVLTFYATTMNLNVNRNCHVRKKTQTSCRVDTKKIKTLRIDLASILCYLQ